MEVKNYHLVYIEGDSFPTERPKADNAYVIHWKAAGIIIPWPKGLTVKQAIIKWAKLMEKEA